VGLDAVSVWQLGFRGGLRRLDVAAGLLEHLVCDSSGCESAEAFSGAEASDAGPVAGHGGTGPGNKSGSGSAAPPDHQSRLRRLRSAARIGAPPRSLRENYDADISSCRSRDDSASSGHGAKNRPQDKFKFRFNERRDFYRDAFDAVVTHVDPFVVASSLKHELFLKKAAKNNGRPFSSPHSQSLFHDNSRVTHH
jgi:hypothetical protein